MKRVTLVEPPVEAKCRYYWCCSNCGREFRYRAPPCSGRKTSVHKRPIQRQADLFCSFPCVYALSQKRDWWRHVDEVYAALRQGLETQTLLEPPNVLATPNEGEVDVVRSEKQH